jgi:hypothetical protein
MNALRVVVVRGTRPEIIKLAGVIHGLGDDATMIHTGQHRLRRPASRSPRCPYNPGMASSSPSRAEIWITASGKRLPDTRH